MGNFRFGLIAASLGLAMSVNAPSFAQDAEERSADAPDIQITNKDECEFEGGSMVPVKGSDYCLVPVRPEEYQSEVYDGNQLGIINCPGDTLNDDLYCLYPVTIRETSDEADDEETSEDIDEDAADDEAGEEE